MQKLSHDLEVIGEKVHTSLSAKHAAREVALQLSRQTIRHCANAIRCVHRGEYDNSRKLLDQSHSLLTEMKSALLEHTDLIHAGFVHDAEKEYAEGTITLAIVSGNSLPDPDTLGIGYPAYLNGMGEAAGELRRHLLDSIREGEFQRGEGLLEAMDEIYSLLVTIDFPDALTGGLRRTTDMVRGVLERSRGDLTMALSQRSLERRLDHFEKGLDREGPP